MVAWILKEITFNISLTLMGIAAIYLVLTPDNYLVNPIYIGIVAVLSQAVFILYDIALTRLISFYLVTLRKRFKF